NPLQIRTLGAFDTPGTAMYVAVSWPFAYVADDNGGLQILDVRNPAQITGAGVFYPGGSPDFNGTLEVELSGRRALGADVDFGLFNVDVSTPAAPVQLGLSQSSWTDLRVFNDKLIAKTVGNLYLLDIANGSFSFLGAMGSYLDALARYPEGAGSLYAKGPGG